MASPLAVLLLLSACLFTAPVGVYGCLDGSCYFDVAISMAVVGVVIFVTVVFITCCCCPWCFMYKLCRQPKPAVTTQVTTVMNMQNIQQQPAVQAVQYPQYQPVPTPMQMRPYQGQQFAPGPPPTYQTAPNPVYPSQHSAFDGGQAMYPMQTPAQPGVAYMHSETSSQPANNPAYMQPPNTDY